MKQCSTCREFKPIEAFGIDRARADGHKYECRDCRAIKAKNYAGGKYAEYAKRQRAKKYGLTLEEYDELRMAAELCAICNDPLPVDDPQAVHLDHDHNSGAIRGVLCRACNVGLGAFKDDSNVLLAAALYLERNHHGIANSF